MSKKDYIAIAACLRECRGETVPLLAIAANRAVIDMVAEQLCEVFAQDNELFDRERFLSAAGVRS